MQISHQFNPSYFRPELTNLAWSYEDYANVFTSVANIILKPQMILLFLSNTLQEKQYLQVERAAFCWETVTDPHESLKLFNQDKYLGDIKVRAVIDYLYNSLNDLN